jgi:multicomponent Na+:H+ antiporter subunit B
VAGAALIYGTLDMPYYGTADAPVHSGIGRYYLERSGSEIGLPNVVTSILASYRGYDTFGELTVIFTAGVGVILLLARKRSTELPRNGARAQSPEATEATHTPPHRMQMMPVLRAVTKALIPVVLLFALYVQAHGDFGPGGGFQAGVIFAAGLIFYAMIYGPDELARIVPLWLTEVAISLGLLIFGGVGVLTLILGKNFLDYSALNPGHPQHGQHWGILVVELGVGITVAAVMLTVYFRFAGRKA